VGEGFGTGGDPVGVCDMGQSLKRIKNALDKNFMDTTFKTDDG